MAQQWIRKIKLVVADQKGDGIDLSNLRIVFSVKHYLVETPNALAARIYNLSDQTANYLLTLSPTPTSNQAGQVVLQAGYEGNFGTIFQGNIVQVRKGRESPTETYLDIFAADGDLAHNWGVTNVSLAAGWTQGDVAKAVQQGMAPYGITQDPGATVTGAQQASRGKVCFGMSRDIARDLAASLNVTWQVRHGQLSFLPQSAYRPGQATVLTADTGMIGLPQQTENGIAVRCLLNPSLGTGSRIWINNASIQRAAFNLSYTAINVFPSISNDGYYKVWWIDHNGDTRADPWYSDIVALALDGTVLPMSVQGAPIPP